MVYPAAPDEEGVAEPVEIAHAFFWNAFFAGQGHNKTFGTAADSAADVQLRIKAAATWQDKGTQGWKDGIGLINLMFELVDFRGSDTRLLWVDIFGHGGQDGAEIEQLVLDALEDGREAGDFEMCVGRDTR